LQWGRRRRLYKTGWSGRDGCSTCSLLFMMRRNSRLSASSISWVSDGSFWLQYPRRRHLFINASIFALSPAKHAPDHAGAAHVSFATIVVQKTSCSDVSLIPWLRKTRSTYSKLLHNARTLVTWSCDVSWPCCCRLGVAVDWGRTTVPVRCWLQ